MTIAAFTEADISALKAAIGQGATKVRFGDREVNYRTLDEMREILAMMKSDVGVATGVRRTRQVRFVTSKGLS